MLKTVSLAIDCLKMGTANVEQRGQPKLKRQRFFYQYLVSLCAGCGAQGTLDDTIAARNMRSYERWVDHFAFELPCPDYRNFPNIGDVEGALCEMTPFFECEIASAVCDDDLRFVYVEDDCSLLLPSGCVPGPIESYSVLTGECLSKNEIQNVEVGTGEGTAFLGRYSLLPIFSNSTSCRECSPDTVTNLCRQFPLPGWNTVAVKHFDGSMIFDATDYFNSGVSARLTGVIDADGSFVVGAVLPETDELGETLIRMEGTFSSGGFLGVLSLRTSNLGFGASDFQQDWDVSYRRTLECPEDGLLACVESGIEDRLFTEMYELAQDTLNLGFETPKAMDILIERCQALCSNDLCSSSCPACAMDLIDYARCRPIR